MNKLLSIFHWFKRKARVGNTINMQPPEQRNIHRKAARYMRSGRNKHEIIF